MSNYKRKEVFDYLTRKPVTTQDIELARSRIQTPVPSQQMQLTPEISNPQVLELATGGRANFVRAGRALTKSQLENILKKDNIMNFQGNTEELSNLTKQYIENYAGGNRLTAARQLGYSTKASNNMFTWKLKKLGVDLETLPAAGSLVRAPQFTQKQLESPITGEAAKLEGTKLLNWIRKQDQLRNYDDINFYRAIEKYKNKELNNNLKKFFEVSGLSDKLKDLAERRNIKFTTLGKDFRRDNTINQLNLIKDNSDVLNFIKNKNFLDFEKRRIANKVAKIIDANPSTAMRRIVDLAHAFSGDKEYINVKTTNKDLLEGSRKISDITEKSLFRDFGASFKRVDYEKSVSKQLGEESTFMRRTRDLISRYLPTGMSVDETKNIASSAKFKTGAYSAFVQGIKQKINAGPKATLIDSQIENTERLLQDLDPLDPDYETKRDIIKDQYDKKVENFNEKVNKNLKKGELPIIVPKLSFDPPSETVANYENLPNNLKKNINNIYDVHGYSFEFPKDLMDIYTAKEYVQTPEGQRDIQRRNEAGHKRVFFESQETGSVPKLYETIRSGFQKYLPGAPFRAGAATADYLIQNYLFNMPAADAAIAASTWIVKNPQAADVMGKTINAALEGKATMQEVKDTIDSIVKNTDVKDLLFSPAINEALTSKTKDLPVVKQESIQPINTDIPNYSEGEVQMKTGGRVHLKNGTDDGYFQEIPSLGLSDPIEILEQQMANEKDPIKILALDYKLEQMKKRKLQEETKAAEEKKLQKEKGIRYMEDFPSQTDYFVETGKQLLTNPKYFYGKGLKGIAEGTEWLVGQPLQTLFSQEGKNWEFYQPVAGEKLGINKFIEENIPKGATTGTLLAGDVAEIAGTFMDPFLAYGIIKGATTTSKIKKPIELEEKIDPTRRDILKTGAILTGGAIVYPTAKKLGLLETSVKAAKVGNAVRVATNPVVDNMPEFFPYLSEFSLRRGKIIGEDYMRSGMTEFKREITIPLQLNTIEKGKTNVKFEFIHNPGEGNVTVYYTNPLTDERHSFDFYQGKQGRQAYGIDPEHPSAWEYYTVEVEPPNFSYKAPNKSDPYRKDYDYYDTATEGDDVIKALDKWYKELPKAEKEKFEKRFITHSEYNDEIPAASYNSDENYPIMEFMYPKKKND